MTLFSFSGCILASEIENRIVSFFEGDSFEDVVRNAVSLGGDTDTIAAIAGAMAEGMFGVPEELKGKCREYLPDGMKQVVDDFYCIIA